MELFLFYVIGLTLVSFVSIILTETPLPILPHSDSDLEEQMIQAKQIKAESNHRIDLVGASFRSDQNGNQAVSDRGSMAEMTASPARAVVED